MIGRLSPNFWGGCSEHPKLPCCTKEYLQGSLHVMCLFDNVLACMERYAGIPPAQQEKEDQAERNIVNSPINPGRVYAVARSAVHSAAHQDKGIAIAGGFS